MFKEVVVLAGGLGTRLREVTGDTPKSMVLVNNRPFLEYLLDHLELYGVKKVILATGYRHDLLANHFKHKYHYLNIEYSTEKEPLGTGGAIRKALSLCETKRVLIMNGDTLFKVNVGKLYDFCLVQKSRLALVLRETSDVSRYGSVVVDNHGIITQFAEKGAESAPGLINGGVYALERNLLEEIGLPEKFSFEKDFLEKYYTEIPFHGMTCKQYFIDIGIPADYEKAQTDFAQFPQY